MTNKKTPLTLPGVSENIYAGFWLRLGSLLLDALILAPVIILILYLNSTSKNAYLITFLPNLAFVVWYRVYLVKKYGGTPGKLIMGIKILKIDGSDVTLKEAILREIVTLCLTVFVSIVTILSLMKASEAYYDSLSWLTKQQYIASLSPVLFLVYTWLSNLWTYGELIVLLFNKRKRAIHDFIAKTVIVRSLYIDKLRATMAEEDMQPIPIKS
ncbi:RDD family protein [Owenweeksia hongkongensis]|uniref:RDD family protein n=1 Tax=Owenweeksia hongkongensis TaxID=253245 RepID=UPI003A92D4CA